MIEPTDSRYFNMPLWCVYGHKAFPSIIACIIRDHGQYGLAVWGYSEYRRSPGYRTLGQELSKFAAANDICEYYSSHDEALARIKELTTPKKSAIQNI